MESVFVILNMAQSYFNKCDSWFKCVYTEIMLQCDIVVYL